MAMETLKLEYKENYAILSLDRGKSNPMNMTMMKELRTVFAELESADSVKGVILTGKQHFFSAGLDLPEVHSYDVATFKEFWAEFMGVMRDMTVFSKPLIAAISGHAPAGGCVLAVTCDYRVMASGNYKIGLNEIPIGIVVPRHLYELYAFWIGRHTAYHFLMEGRMVEPQQAKEVGLVDLVVPEDQVLDAAERKLKQYLSFEQSSWKITKSFLRRPLVEAIDELSEDDMNLMLNQWWSEPVQAKLKSFVENLKKR
jgi:enoyl-CoA hydratase/carnithine racemase